jgi:hypothetical protein
LRRWKVGEMSIFEIIKPIIFWVSPLIFLVGLLLLIAEYRYRKLEETLGREVGGLKKKIMPGLETTIYSFQNSLLSKRIIVGIIFIVCSVIFFFTFRG